MGVAPISLAATAYDSIKRDIIRCHLVGGAELTEQHLAQRYALGKTPVRDALRQLAQEGLVQILPRRGYVVRPVSLRDVREIFALRLLLEPEAARLSAARMDPALLAELTCLCQVATRTDASGTIDEILTNHGDFHLAIARGSRNARLVDILGRLLDETDRLFYLGVQVGAWTAALVSEHQELLGALATGNGDAAAQIVDSQIRAFEQRLLAVLRASPRLEAINLAATPT